jgi:hypothetical protein
LADLDAVYDMTWAEFQIRLFAFKRMELTEYSKMRELMWINYIAPHLDPKKMVKKKEQLMPLTNDKKSTGGVSEEHKQLFLKEYKKWQEASSKSELAQT